MTSASTYFPSDFKTVNYCLIYHTFCLQLALYARCVRICILSHIVGMQELLSNKLSINVNYVTIINPFILLNTRIIIIGLIFCILSHMMGSLAHHQRLQIKLDCKLQLTDCQIT